MLESKIKYHVVCLYLLISFLTVVYSQTPKSQNIERELRRMASGYERARQFERAAELYTELCFREKENLSSYLGAKRNFLAIKAYDRLRNLIIQLQQKKRVLRYEVDLALIEYLSENEQKAVEHWQTILEDNSRNKQAYSLVGSAMVENRLFDNALQNYKKARKIFQDESLFIFEIANIYTLQSELEQVTIEYLRFLEKNRHQVLFIDSRLSAISTTKETVEKVAKTLKKALKKKPDLSQQILQLLGNLLTRNRQYHEALSYYRLLEEDKPEEVKKNNQLSKEKLLYDFALTASRDGEHEYAREAYELIIQNNTHGQYALQAKFGLAKLYENRGNTLEAIRAYETFITSHPKSTEAVNALLRVGDLWLDEKENIEQAQNAYNRIIKDYHGNSLRITAFFRLAKCALVQDKLSEAERIYSKIMSESVKDPKNKSEAKYQLALLKFYQAQPSRAKSYLEEVLNTEDNEKKTLNLLENDALELYMLIQEHIADSSALAIIGKSKLLLLQKKENECRRLVELYLLEHPDAAIKDEMLFILIQVYRSSGESDLALQACTQVMNEKESFYKDLALKTKAEIYELDLMDYNKAQESYETLLAIFPQSIYIEETRKRIRALEKLN